MPGRFTSAAFTAILTATAAFGQASAIPQLSSRPGAAYTVYMNFGGFSFTGVWGGTGTWTPGVTPAYTVDADAATFNAGEIANIRNVWSRTAEKYAAYNVNVTTVDPAPAGSSDFQRQAYYETQARTMHSVIGGNGSWIGGGGYSFIGTTQNAYNPAGINGGAGAGNHTNWSFSAQAPSNLQFLGEVTAHENGHGLRLNHQSLWTGTPPTFQAQYDTGTGTGAGSVAPIMGNSYSAQRGTWRVGATTSNSSVTAQNDAAVMLTNSGIAGNGAGGFMDSGVGHTTLTATVLPLTGTAIDSAAAKGLIAPNAAAATPLGAANYTTDVFTFTVAPGAPVNATVVLRSGRSTIAPGAADPGATLNATLRLLDGAGLQLAIANTGVLTETITANGLTPGTYYFEIRSAGGTTDANGYTYYDMGSYFLTGTIAPVPEPAALLVLVSLAAAGGRLARRQGRAISCPSS